jgi:hypothetical protein
MVITQEELNIPNFIELYLERANTSISKSQLFQNILTDKRLIVKFSHRRVYLQETDQIQIELEYKNVLYLNNSITNENFFCLAYAMPSEEKSRSSSSKNKVNALILYSNDVEIIDDVIREYAYYISSELNKKDSKIRYTNGLDEEYSNKVEQHTCYLCPMQQFIELCEYLNTYTNQQEINDILIEKLNQNLDDDDQSYLLDCLNYHSLTMETYSNLRDKNQLIVALIHKICKKKQIQHLIETLKRKNEESLLKRNDEFSLMKNSKFVGCCSHSKSSHSNLDCLKTDRKGKALFSKRSKSVDSSPNPSPCISSFCDNKKHILASKNKENKQDSPQNKLVFEKFFEKLSSDTNLDANGIFLSNKDCTKRFIFNKIVGFPTSVCIVSTSMPLSSVNIATKPTIEQVEELMCDKEMPKAAFVFKRFSTRGDILKFWKKVISEQIILNKMEKENRKLSIRAACAARKELKNSSDKNFKYVEITPCLKEAITVWKALISNQYSSLAVLTLNEIDSPNDELAEKVFELEKIRKIVFKGKLIFFKL